MRKYSAVHHIKHSTGRDNAVHQVEILRAKPKEMHQLFVAMKACQNTDDV